MSKETSPAIASLAAKVVAGGYEPTPAEVRSLAASALSQREDEEPDASVAPATVQAVDAASRFDDETALGEFIYQKLCLQITHTRGTAFRLGQDIKRYIAGEA